MMNLKILNKIKYFSLLLIITMYANCLASVVSDNDGSAFITKAEFDSLKNNFQNQIDQYNTTIDSKIDDAIASYLSGVKVEKKSTVTLISEISTSTGKGYRSRKGNGGGTSDTGNQWLYPHRVTAEWVLGLSSAVAFRAAWKDRDNGEVYSLYSNTGLTSQTLPSGQTSAWWIDQGSTYGIVRVTNGAWVMGATGIQSFSGQTTMTMSNYPTIYVDKNGVVQEYANRRALIIDMRAVRGANGASANSRYYLLAGVPVGTTPAHYEWPIDTLYDGLPIICRNEQDSAGAGGFGYVYATIKEPTVSYNPNIFVWNPVGVTTAYDSSCEVVEVNEDVNCVPIGSVGGDYQFSGDVVRMVWGGSASGNGSLNTSQTTVPYISFSHAGRNTNLPSDAFETVSGFPYGRLKLKYLQLKDFKSIEVPTRNLYSYEGLPIYTSDKDGTLEFDIKIEKSKKETGDVTNVTLWNDPSTTMKIRIKDKPFTIGDDYSECIKTKINNVESKEGTVTAGTVTTVSCEVEANKTYYIRWYCDGYDYGGEIIYLGNASLTTES